MNNKKKLAIIGASYLQLPLVEKAHELNIETHCFAWDDGTSVCKEVADYFYPISVLEKDEILKTCQNISIDGITTIATDICTPTINYISTQMKLVGNSINCGELTTNKFKMRQALKAADVKIPSFQIVNNINGFQNSDINYPLIVKPTDRSGSKGVSKVESSNQLDESIQRAMSNSLEKKVIIEDFIEGIEVSVEAISWNGEHHILAITDKITTGQPYFVELEHHQPSLLPVDILNQIKLETVKALDALEVKNGASHTEIKVTRDNELYIIEIGSRMGGDFIGSHLVRLSTGYDFLKGVIDIALGDFLAPEQQITNSSGVYFYCENTSYLKNYFEMHFPWEVEKKINFLPLRDVKESNDRSGYIIYSNEERLQLSGAENLKNER